jgi:RNA polymerase sigma-70 factor, ECF subfamily
VVDTVEPNEISLVRDAVAGSVDAFGKLVILYQHNIYGYVLGVVGNAADARDVAQETFLLAYRSLGQLRSPETFRSWLYTIAVNQCRNLLKRRGRERARFVASSAEAGEVGGRRSADIGSVPSPRDAAEASETGAAVAAAIAALPDTYREVAVMRFRNGLKVSRIAAALGLTVAAVESRLRRARSELCKGLAALRRE